MKTKSFTLILSIFFLISVTARAQKVKPDESRILGGATKSEEFLIPCAGQINTPTADLKWRPLLIKKYSSFKPSIPDADLIRQIKEQKLQQKFQSNSKSGQNENEIAGQLQKQAATPTVGTNFLGNTNNGSSPMDNSIAISDGGIVISVANKTLEIDDDAGNNLYYNDIATFFNDPAITVVCDPVIVYDRQADRFIFFAQECSGNSANSKILVCFSQTNNPASGGWWKYKLSGNPLNNNTWFDYPKLAISNNELYVAGNLFSNAGVFDQAIVYQMNKNDGYSGANLNMQYWFNIDGSPFTIMPVSNGQGQAYGPGCYMVATSSAGASTIKVYDLTDDMTATNEQLNYYSVSTTPYSPSADSYQSGTTCMLDNGDCRSLSGFYLNGVIHFVFHSDVGSGWNGINYNRLLVGAMTNTSKTFGLAGSFDYSYPSVSSYGLDANDRSVMIGFGRVSSSSFPQIRVVCCDDAMFFSPSTLIKAGDSFTSYTSTSKERWGDYTGTARKHNNITPTVWVNGMYGTNLNKWNTWIAEVYGTGGNTSAKAAGASEEMKVYPNPAAGSFSIEFALTGKSLLQISVMDISGKVIRELYQGVGSEGTNIFSFNTANLAAGTYYLVIKSNADTIKNEKIIIAD